MTRKINNIKVLKSKYGTTVYIDFDNGYFGTRHFENGKWSSSGLTDEELAAAKKLAVVDGKWQNWKAPRENTTSYTPRYHYGEGDVIDDINAQREFDAKHAGDHNPYADQNEENLASRGL